MRIMIFGRPGSGKTTFAFELSQKLKLPLYHLDRYFYKQNWVEQNYETFLKIQKNLVNKKSWIIDGNSTKSLEMRYKHADIAIYFCYPKYIALWRVIKRKFFSKKNSRINDRAEGCHETIQWSLIKYLWKYEDLFNNKIVELRKEYPLVKFYVVRNKLDLKNVMQILRCTTT